MRAYYIFCPIPLILVSVFFLVESLGPGGKMGLALVLYLAEAITITCPLITFAGLILIVVEAVNHRSIAASLIATIVAALPGIIFWIIEHG
jgi:hypothetical protein